MTTTHLFPFLLLNFALRWYIQIFPKNSLLSSFCLQIVLLQLSLFYLFTAAYICGLQFLILICKTALSLIEFYVICKDSYPLSPGHLKCVSHFHSIDISVEFNITCTFGHILIPLSQPSVKIFVSLNPRALLNGVFCRFQGLLQVYLKLLRTAV